MTAAIEVHEVHKAFGRGERRVQALAGVSLSVAPGEIYGLLGRNGAGKTTLVKILLDIVRPSAGHTALQQIPSSHVAARQLVGYLPEDHRFVEYQTASSAVAFYGALSGMDRETVRARVPELLEHVGLTHAATKKVRGFSKGMKQRLGLAQALVHDPQVLFLDEPTDGVDPVGRAEIRDLLAQLKAQGKTIFLNSHLLSEVEQLCDRVGIMERGVLVREGSIEELTQSDHVYRVRTHPPVDPATRAALEPLCVSVAHHADGELELGLSADKDIDPVVDLLRERGIGIRGLEGKRMSLEQVFLHAVEEQAS